MRSTTSSKRPPKGKTSKRTKVTATGRRGKRARAKARKATTRAVNRARAVRSAASAKPRPKTTPLRERFWEDLKLASYAESTQEAYVRAVRQLAEHYRQSPDTLCDQQIRDYFLYLKQVKHFARGSMSIAFSGIRFFYEKTCPKDRHVPLPLPTLILLRPSRFDLSRPPWRSPILCADTRNSSHSHSP